MIKLENFEVMGWEHAIRGMRNPMNSWEKTDSRFNINCDLIACDECPTRGEDDCCGKLNIQTCNIGPNDHNLMMKLAKGGSVHAKYRRMITVYVDITAPLYWWKEFDTYKVGTVANSCSTMHKIHEKEFTLEDFSCEKLLKRSKDCLLYTISVLNLYREDFLKAKEGNRSIDPKEYWWQMIQLLPSSYNQRRTVMLNYEVLTSIYRWRKDHKLDEWREFCKWIEQLPYSEIITGGNEDDE